MVHREKAGTTHFYSLWSSQSLIMGQLLGKSADKPKNEEKKKKISEKDQAVLKLKRARDKLTKLQKRVMFLLMLCCVD